MSQAETITTLEALSAGGQGVRVEFQKTGDRFSHTIFSVSAEGTQPLLKSVEGTPEDMSPASPPFAELHQQGEIIFLSGATTIGHWSMSVQAQENRLLFEVACRIKAAPEKLCSSYLVLAPDSNLGIENDSLIKRTDEQLQITHSREIPTGYPATIQWRYSIA